MTARVIELFPAEMEQERCSCCLVWHLKLALTLVETVFPQGLYCTDCCDLIDDELDYGCDRCPVHGAADCPC